MLQGKSEGKRPAEHEPRPGELVSRFDADDPMGVLLSVTLAQKGEREMLKFDSLSRLASAAIVATVASATHSMANAHEGEEHGMECNTTSMKEMNTDIQAMNDGEAKTGAMKEMQMSEDMMSKNDMKACMDHMNKAREIMEK